MRWSDNPIQQQQHPLSLAQVVPGTTAGNPPNPTITSSQGVLIHVLVMRYITSQTLQVRIVFQPFLYRIAENFHQGNISTVWLPSIKTGELMFAHIQSGSNMRLSSDHGGEPAWII